MTEVDGESEEPEDNGAAEPQPLPMPQPPTHREEIAGDAEAKVVGAHPEVERGTGRNPRTRAIMTYTNQFGNASRCSSK